MKSLQIALALSVFVVPVLVTNFYPGGKHFCMSEGLVSESSFAEDLYPTVLENLRSGHRYKNPPDVKISILEERLSAAFEALGACYDQRGTEHCRYIGSDEDALVLWWNEPRDIHPDEYHQYRQIVPHANFSIALLPIKSVDGGDLTFRSFNPDWEHSQSVCDVGCDCNVDFGH